MASDQPERAVLGGHRAAPVVVGQAVEAEQAGLDPVPALGQVVAALHGVDQRGDGGVAGLVDQVPRGQPVVVVAQAVVGGLLEEDGVQDEGPGAQAGRQPFGDRLGRGLADRAVRVGEEREAVLEAPTLAVERHLDGRVLLLEQPLPGRDRGQVLLGRDPLLGLGQEVGPAEAGDAQEVADGIEARVGQERLGPLVVEGGPLELEEQQLGADRGGPLLDLGDQRAARLVAGVGGEAQAGVAVGPGQVLLERGEAVHERGQPGGVQLGHVAPASRPARRPWRRPGRAGAPPRPRRRRRPAAPGPSGRDPARRGRC